MSFMYKLIDETQMPITAEHPFKEKSTKLLTLLPLRTIYFRTFQCETVCSKEDYETENGIFRIALHSAYLYRRDHAPPKLNFIVSNFNVY